MYSPHSQEAVNNLGNMLSPALSKALTLSERYRNGSKRTPRTLTRLMQQHRESERHRHHGLNASIRELSKTIPGYEDTSKETKIVKLQRVINYICHLEGHIQGLCEDLGMGLDFKSLFLSPHVAKPTESKKPVRSQTCTSLFTPKQENTSGMTTSASSHWVEQTEATSQWTNSENPSPFTMLSLEDSNSSSQPPTTSVSGTSGSSSDDWVIRLKNEPEDDCALQDKEYSGHAEYLELSSLLSSSDARAICEDADIKNVLCGLENNSEFGINGPHDDLNCEPLGTASGALQQMLEEPAITTGTYSSAFKVHSKPPATILEISPIDVPVARISSPSIKEEPSSDTSSPTSSTPCSTIMKRPLGESQVTYTSPFKTSSFSKVYSPPRKRPKKLDFSTGGSSAGRVPFQWQFQNGIKADSLDDPSNTDIKSEVPFLVRGDGVQLQTVPESTKCEESVATLKNGRIDHRKTSWMNGFMMYSRIHRRKYIEDNPGVHTSYISKLMGQDWRKLKPDEQIPYKEKAKAYIEHHLRPRARSFEDLGVIPTPMLMVANQGITQ